MISEHIRDLAIAALHYQDDSRERSQQTIPGPSSAGGCARAVYGSYKGWPAPNDEAVQRLAAIRGTAMHKTIEEALNNPAVRERIRRENQEISYLLDGCHIEGEWPGIPGLLGDAHVDFYHEPSGTVVDWKNPSKTPGKEWPSRQYEWQLSLYGYLLTRAGRHVENLVIVAFPCDKQESGAIVWQRAYDPAVAQEALEWLREQHERATQGAPPDPEKPWWFCKRFCRHYSPGWLCGGVRSFGK